MKKSKFSPGFLRPEVLLILLALGLATVSLFPADNNRAIDIHLHDTYYVISTPHAALFISIPIALAAIIYFLTRNYRQWAVLQYFHIACIVVFLIGGFQSSDFTHDYSGSAPIPFLAGAVIWSFVLGNLAFIINLFAGFIRGKNVEA